MAKPVITLHSPADILAAIPALVRFVPDNSVVALMFSHASGGQVLDVRCAIRFDLTISVAQAAAFPETCGLSAEHNAAALLAAICEPGLDRHARQVLNTARAALHYAGIPVLKMLTTASLTEPGQWVDPDTGEHGPTIPYTDSVLYGRAAVDRVVINASRRDIEAEFAPTEPAPLLTVESTDFAQLAADTATQLRQAIVGHITPSPHLAARAAILVTAHIGLRDALMRLGLDHELAAAHLWTTIAAHLRGSVRAQVLTIAAFNYYLANDSIRAGVALDNAEEVSADTDTEPPALARLLRAAIRAGLPTNAVRTAVPTRQQAPIPGTEL